MRQYLNQCGLQILAALDEVAQALKSTPARIAVAWFLARPGMTAAIANGDVPNATMRERFDQDPLRGVRQVVAYLAGKDANFLFGTDTPSASDLRESAWAERLSGDEQLRKAGLSLAQVFRAATINNAREFKIDSQVGTIEPGKIPNLVLLGPAPIPPSWPSYAGFGRRLAAYLVDVAIVSFVVVLVPITWKILQMTRVLDEPAAVASGVAVTPEMARRILGRVAKVFIVLAYITRPRTTGSAHRIT